jgi:hypothetical protein
MEQSSFYIQINYAVLVSESCNNSPMNFRVRHHGVVGASLQPMSPWSLIAVASEQQSWSMARLMLVSGDGVSCISFQYRAGRVETRGMARVMAGSKSTMQQGCSFGPTQTCIGLEFLAWCGICFSGTIAPLVATLFSGN